MSRVLNVRVVTQGVVEQANRLDALLDRAAMAHAAVDSVNLVTRRADESTRQGEIADLGLTDAYVRSKTDLLLASRTPRAEITVRGDLTILSRYPLTQNTKAAPRAKGDPSRGIGAGSKQAGLTVGIKRSAPTAQPKWFLMRLRSGAVAGSNNGVFVRVGPARNDVKHIYGPSPYSLFRHQVGLQIEDIADDLQRTTDAAIGDAIQRNL